jgi:glycine cleavage system aminomethyltransferase T
LKTRIKELLNPKRVPTAVWDHIKETGHRIRPIDFGLIAREELKVCRKNREDLEIESTTPT